MPKKNAKRESGKAIQARIKKEMAQPRMAKSARDEEVIIAAARMRQAKGGKTRL